VFANPQYSEEALLSEYSESSGKEEKSDTGVDLGELYASRLTPETWSQFDRTLAQIQGYTNGPGALVDVGSGAAYFVERAQCKGWDAYGVEVGDWAAAVARERSVENIRIGTLADQNFDDESFDAVTANQVLEHLPNPTRELKEIYRILKPGGVFYANVPNFQCLSILLGRDDFEGNHPMGHLSYFTPKTLARLIDNAGFKTQSTYTYGGLKWENIIGRRTNYPHKKASTPRDSLSAKTTTPVQQKQSLVKATLMPIVDTFFYRGLKVGMELEILALKAES
jgi:ubiquinone/menaquinone biosynthesis C-methylase UbiE